MSEQWDEFFIRKMRQGLAAQGNSLAPEEEAILRTAVLELSSQTSFTPERAQALQTKCIAALSAAYQADTAGKNRNAALEWRENNEALYKFSKFAISGIVQNWYLSVGRGLERKTTGCLPVVLVLSGALALAVKMAFTIGH